MIYALKLQYQYYTENNNNAVDITIRLKKDLIKIDNRIIYNYLSQIRNYIAHFYHNKYKLEKLSYFDDNKRFAIDESLFVYIGKHYG